MKRLSFLLIAIVAACGGDDEATTSGIDSSKAVTSLSTDEVSDFCSWSIDVQGGPGHVTMCGTDTTITTSTQAECEADYAMLPQTCSGLTVADLEGCVNAMGSDPCTAFAGPACAELISCATGG